MKKATCSYKLNFASSPKSTMYTSLETKSVYTVVFSQVVIQLPDILLYVSLYSTLHIPQRIFMSFLVQLCSNVKMQLDLEWIYNHCWGKTADCSDIFVIFFSRWYFAFYVVKRLCALVVAFSWHLLILLFVRFIWYP